MASLDRVRADQSSVNLSTLSRYDPQIQSLVYTGKHCVLYDLSSSGQWVNRNVEGPFFVIERSSSSSCRFRMIVLNRKDMDNFIADISPQCNLEDQNPYIFFRSTPSSTPLSIWFYDSDDAIHAFKALQSCIDATKSGAAIKTINTNNTPNTTPSTKTNNNTGGPNQSETIRNNAKAAAMKAGKAASDASISLHQVPPPSLSVPPALSTTDSAALQARLLNVLKDFDSADEQQIKKFHEEKTQKQKEKELIKKKEDEKKQETKTAFQPIANQINHNKPSSPPSTTTTPASDGGQQLQSLLKSLKQQDGALLTPLPSVPMMAAADLERSIRIAAEKQKASTNNPPAPAPAPVSAPSTLPHHPTVPHIIPGIYPHNPSTAYPLPPNPSAIPPMFYPNAPPSTTAPSSSLHSLIGSFAAMAIPSPAATPNPPPNAAPTPPSSTSSASTPYFPYLANLYASSSTTTAPPSSASLLPPHYFQSGATSSSNPYSIFDSAPSASASAGKPSGSASHLSKEAFKASLITLLNDSRYLDQLYQRYLSGYPPM